MPCMDDTRGRHCLLALTVTWTHHVNISSEAVYQLLRGCWEAGERLCHISISSVPFMILFLSRAWSIAWYVLKRDCFIPCYLVHHLWCWCIHIVSWYVLPRDRLILCCDLHHQQWSLNVAWCVFKMNYSILGAETKD